MRRLNKERIKSITIIALFVISLIQVGILWSNQTNRLPISFLTGIFGKPKIPVSEMTRNELFIPYKLVVSNGEGSHWTPDRKNEIFMPLWDEVKAYLGKLAGDKEALSLYTKETWGKIASKRGFVFEFKSAIPPDLIKWFLGNPNSTADIPAVYKIMVVPDYTNDSLNTVYINDMNGNVYKYLPDEFSRKKAFPDILSMFDNDEQNDYREFTSFRDSNLSFGVEPDASDILYAYKNPKYWPYSSVSSTVPGSMKNMDQLAQALLGSEKEKFARSKYEDGTFQFDTNVDLYKIYPGGIMEYKYFSESASNDANDVGAALQNAYDFIKKTAALTGEKADIYLSGVEPPQSGNYVFTFDYMVDGLTIYMDIPSGTFIPSTLENAFRVQANGDKVVSCSAIIRDFAASGKRNFNDRLLDIPFDSTYDKDQLKLKSAGVGYVLKTVDNGLLEPYMVLENKAAPKLITGKMSEEKGD